MDANAKLNFVAAPATSLGEQPPVRFSLRHWFAIALLIVYWSFQFAVFRVDLAMFQRFMSRSLASLAFVLVFLIWWGFNRSLSRKTRLLGVGLLVVGAVVSKFLADKTFDGFAIVMVFLPYIMTGWMLLTTLGRNLSQKTQLAAMTAIVVGVGVYFCAVRMDGIDGRQQAELNWRWTPTREELFLADAAKHAPAKAATESSDSSTDGPTAAESKTCELQPGDWAEFRGPARNSGVSGLALAGTFADAPPELVWRQKVGPGWSSLIVVDGRLFTQEQRGDNEAVVCYDAATGQQTWIHEDPVRFSEALAGAGPRGTPTFHEGRIYTLGGTGLLNCLEASSGKKLWSRDIAAEAKSKPPMWGFSASPLVVNNLAVVFASGESKSWQAYQVEKGDLAWTAPGGLNSYSSAQLVTLHGQSQILLQDNKSIKAVNAADGKPIWEQPGKSEFAMPMLQPYAVDDHRLLIQSDPGIALLEVKRDGDQWSTSELWTSSGLKPSFNDYVVSDEKIYGLDDGIFACLDLTTGERAWKKGRYGHGQILLLKEQKQIVILSEQGEVILVAADPEGLRELGRVQAISGKTWNHPVVAHGHLYVRNGEEMACLRLRVSGGVDSKVALRRAKSFRLEPTAATNYMPTKFTLIANDAAE